MRQLLGCFLALLIAISGLATPHEAKADTMRASAVSNMCVDWNTSTNKISLWSCNGGYNQNFFTTNYGQQRYGNWCLASTGAGQQLVMQPCDASKGSQRWTLVTDTSAPGALRNEAGYCADIQNGWMSQGTSIIAYTCKQNGAWFGRTNQIWNREGAVMAGQAGVSRNHLHPGVINPGDVFDSYGNKMGVVAQGGLNLVNTNGSNAKPFPPNCNCIVAQGGGNVVALPGGMIVAQGGLNFAPTSGGGK